MKGLAALSSAVFSLSHLQATPNYNSMQQSSDPFSDAPIARLLGFNVLPGGPGEATVVIDCGVKHHNPMGRAQGGLLSAVADAAMGIAFARTLADGQDFSTIELKINFIRPVITGLVEARAKVIERGLRIGFIECELLNERGKRVATATSTCTVVSLS